MKKIIESIVKNVLKESQEEYNFLSKIKKENPSLYSRFYSIIKNKGLEVAIEKYKEYDPEIIKQNQKAQAKLTRQVSKLEKDAQAYSEMNDFVTFFNYIRKEFSVNKRIAETLKTSNLNPSGMKFTIYKTVDHITPLYNSNPNRLKYLIDKRRILPFETTEIFNKLERSYNSGDGDTIIIKSYINPEEEDITYDIKFHLFLDYMVEKLPINYKIVNALKEKWNNKNLNNLSTESAYNVIDDFIDSFSKENIENIRLRILAKSN